MCSFVILLMSIVAFGLVHSQNPRKCTSIDIHRWPGSGYRARITVVSPVTVRRFRSVILTMKFDKVVQRIESVHIGDARIRYIGSNTMKKEMKLQFSTKRTIYRRQKVSQHSIDLILLEAVATLIKGLIYHGPFKDIQEINLKIRRSYLKYHRMNKLR